MMSDTLLHVGTILGVHGLKGTVTVYSDTRPASGIAGYACWYLGDKLQEAKPYKVIRCWQHGKGMLVELEGIENRDQAALLKRSKIWVERDAVDVQDDEYLWDTLVGCKVFHHDVQMGHVVALEAYGAQDILVVHTDEAADQQGEWLLPFTAQVIQGVDEHAQRIDIELLDGMDACFTPKS